MQTIIFILITPTEIVRNHNNKQNALRRNICIFFHKVYLTLLSLSSLCIS